MHVAVGVFLVTAEALGVGGSHSGDSTGIGLLRFGSPDVAREAGHRVGLGHIGLEANATEHGHQHSEGILEPTAISGSNETIVCIKQCDMFKFNSTANVQSKSPYKFNSHTFDSNHNINILWRKPFFTSQVLV